MSIWPGHRFPRNVEQRGFDPLEESREGGERYVRAWLRVLKARPRFVTVADWNNFEEETAIEESYAWEDPKGYALPDLYVRITRAYSRLRHGILVNGEYYREEGSRKIYRYEREHLVSVKKAPDRGVVIVTPAGALQSARSQQDPDRAELQEPDAR
jgi:hypothetical protein